MTCSRFGVTVVVLATLGAGCSAGQGDVDGMRADSLVYLVRNEVFRIGIDGNQKQSLGRVGYNRYRTGWPRILPDGRIAVLGDEWGIIKPYITDGDGHFTTRGITNVMVHDSLAGVTVNGQSRLILTVTPWSAHRAAMHSIDVDDNQVQKVAAEQAGQLLHPSPYADGQVLAVRTNGAISTVEILDVTQTSGNASAPIVLAQVAQPWLATQPVRLPDGRVAFLRIAANDVDPLPKGDVYIIEADGTVIATNFKTVIALTVVGKYFVMESGGMDDVSDIVATDFYNPPFNITRTPFVSEHLTWSD